MGLDSEDGLSSSDDLSVSSHIIDKEIPIDSDENECQSSGSNDSNLDDINGDVDLDEDNRWHAYSVENQILFVVSLTT